MESIEERMKTERGETYESMRIKVIEISKESGIVSPETSFIMLEIIEDPVLGMPITHIIPLNISEETRKNISDANFLDGPSFTYTRTGGAANAGISKKGNEILDAKYPRQEIFRLLAKNQFADGSFVDVNNDNLYNKIETTAMVLLAFTMGKEDIGIYANQLTKSIRFLVKEFQENSSIFDERLLTITAAAFKSCSFKDLMNETLNMQVNSILKVLTDEKVLRIVNSTTKISPRDVASVIFNMSADGKTISEQITIKEEKNSIYSLAKLGVLKSI
jgi:Ca-activated chloride channel family protein